MTGFPVACSSFRHHNASMKSLLTAGLLLSAFSLSAQTGVAPGPDRSPDEGEGPFKRLIIRGATVVDETGAPPQGPMDIVAPLPPLRRGPITGRRKCIPAQVTNE